jgi:hypothetical protein
MSQAISEIIANYNLIQTANFQIDATRFVFEQVAVNYNVDYPQNTSIRVRLLNNTGLIPNRHIYYDRVNLSLAPDALIVTKGAATRVSEIISLINGYLELDMDLDDYINETIVGVIGEFRINSKSGSYKFIGNLKITLEEGSALAIRQAS